MIWNEKKQTYTLDLSPEYLSQVEYWDMIDIFTRGYRKEVVDRFLQPHQTEQGETAEAKSTWQGRKNRTGYENDMESTIQIHLGHLSQNISLGDAADDPKLKPIIEDVTIEGEPLDEHFEHLLEAYIMDGKVGVLVTGPSNLATDRQEKVERGEQSYQILYRANQILETKQFSFGKNKGKFEEVVLQGDPEVIDSKKYDVVWRYSLVDKEVIEGTTKTVTTHYQKEKLVSTKTLDKHFAEPTKVYRVAEVMEGGLGTIPFVQIGKGLKESFVKNLASIVWKLLQDRSVRDNVNYYQGFKWSIVCGAKPEEISARAEFLVTVVSNPEATVQTVDAGTPDGLNVQIDRLENKGRRIGQFAYNQVSSEGTGQVSSADSKEQDQKAKIKIYNRTISKFQAKLKELFKYHAEFENYQKEVSITISREFGLSNELAQEQRNSLVFARANSFGARGLAANILKLDAMKIQVVPKKGENEKQARERMLDEIDAITEQKPAAAAPRGSVGNV